MKAFSVIELMVGLGLLSLVVVAGSQWANSIAKNSNEPQNSYTSNYELSVSERQIKTELSQLLRLIPACKENIPTDPHSGEPLLKTHDGRPIIPCDAIAVRGGFVVYTGFAGDDAPTIIYLNQAVLDANGGDPSDTVTAVVVDSSEDNKIESCRLLSHPIFQNPAAGSIPSMLVSDLDDPTCANLQTGGTYILSQSFRFDEEIKTFANFFTITDIQDNFSLSNPYSVNNELGPSFDICSSPYDEEEIAEGEWDVGAYTQVAAINSEYEDDECNEEDSNIYGDDFVQRIIAAEGQQGADDFLQSLRVLYTESVDNSGGIIQQGLNQFGGMTSSGFNAHPDGFSKGRAISPPRIIPVKVIQITAKNGRIVKRELTPANLDSNQFDVASDWQPISLGVESFRVKALDIHSMIRSGQPTSQDVKDYIGFDVSISNEGSKSQFKLGLRSLDL